MVIKDATIEIKDEAMANTEAIARLEGHICHLVAEFNKIEEEEFQTQEMARGQYMIDVDGPSNSYHEHVQATVFGSEEVVKETVNEPSLEDHLEACLAQFGDDLDLDKLLEQADAILDPTPEVRTKNRETTEISFLNTSSLAVEPFIVDSHEEEEKEEQVKQFEPPPNPNMPNDKEVSTKAHSFVTIPLKTYHEPKVSSSQCLEVSSYVEIFKDSRTQDHKFRNRVPKRILRNKVNYIRWRNILQEGYQILKKNGWKGLVGHPHDRGGAVFFLFYFLHFIFESFYFVSNSN
jgi:hypothetical protein